MKKIIAMFAVALIFFSCSSEKTNKSSKIQIVTTIGMIEDLVKNIGKEKVEVKALMGPGIDPHLYKASENDVSLISSADILFFNGLHLEAKMGEIFEKISKTKTSVAVSDIIDKKNLITVEGSEMPDPHIWFDVLLWIKVSERIEQVLSQEDSANKDFYNKNLNEYKEKMFKMHQYVINKADSLPKEKRVIITAHDAFKYFGKAYGFNVKGIQGISTVSEAGAADIKELADFISENKIPAIFVETTVSPKSINALKEAVKNKGFNLEIGGELFSDAMGNPGTPEGTYLGMVKHNIDTIFEALSK